MGEHFFRSGKSSVYRLERADTVAVVEALPVDTPGVYVCQLDDQKALALTRLTGLKAVYQDGNSRLTDTGLRALAGLQHLEALDLTSSHGVTEAGLAVLAGLQHLQWLAVTDCTGLTPAALAALRRALPRCDIEPVGG